MKCTWLILILFFSSISNGQNKNTTVNEQTFESDLINGFFKEGDSLFKSEDFGLALPLFLKIDSISKATNFKNQTTINATLLRAQISKLTFTKESSEIAYLLGKEALNSASEIKDTLSVNLCYVTLSDFCQLTRRFEEAKIYIDKGLEYFTKFNDGYEGKVSRLYLMESAYYFGKNELEKAEKSRYNAIRYLEGKDNDYEMAKAKYYYGHFLRYYKKEFKKAIPFLEDSKILHQKINKVENETYHRCVRDLAICYDTLGSHEVSKTYYQEAYNLKVELDKRANRNTSRRLETKYQTEKKIQEIALLKSEKALDDQKQRSQRNLLLAGLGFTTLAGIFLFVLYRNRQKTNKKLKELDTAKSNFFANISHEFRTPLTLILDPIDAAIEDPSLSDNKREQFIMAKHNSDRLLSLVNQLLDLSKIDAGQLKLHIQKGNIQNIISGLAEAFKFSAEQQNISYQLNIEKSNEESWFDKDALEKITVNLLSNAIKYTPLNGVVTCNSVIENKTLRLNVKNTGVGFTKSELESIFMRFYQTDSENEGTGIGLALVKELVELHKGTIKVDSQPKAWVCFSVTLPIDKHSFKDEVFIDAPNDTALNYKVPSMEVYDSSDDEFEESDKPILLIVEDNNDVRMLLKQNFEDHFNILTAQNGQIGLDLAIEHVPDIIISDIMMPVKDGVALTNELKNNELTNHIPIILLTAKAGDKNEIIGLEIGADDYITKPFNSKILKTKVSNLIAIRRNLQSRYSQEIVLTPKDVAVNNLDEKFLEKIQEVLEKRLIESSFNVEYFSDAVGMSRMQLHRKIKALTGLSASEFIRSQRLKLAADLLKSSDINISQVGYSVGFNDHSYFAKCFKNVFNCTPTEYAKQHYTK